jgi:hypothetical protein
MRYKKKILSSFLKTSICAFFSFIGYCSIVIVQTIINDTVSNNKIMEENEKEYKKIIHPKETKALGFKNQIVAPPNSGHQCWFSITELRVMESNINSGNISSRYKALNGEFSHEILFFSLSYSQGLMVQSSIGKLEEEWNVNLKDKNIENIYVISTLSSGKEDADLRCLL